MPHCSLDKDVLGINQLEQRYDNTSSLVESYYLPLEKGMVSGEFF